MKFLPYVVLALFAAGHVMAKSPSFVLKPGDPWNYVPYHESVEPKTPEQRHQLAVAFWKDYLCSHPELVPVIRDALPAGERQLEYLRKWYPEKYR